MTEDVSRLVTIQTGQAARVKPAQFFDQSLQEGVSSHVAMLVPTTDRSAWLTTWFVSESAMELCYKAIMHAAGVDRRQRAILARGGHLRAVLRVVAHLGRTEVLTIGYRHGNPLTSTTYDALEQFVCVYPLVARLYWVKDKVSGKTYSIPPPPLIAASGKVDRSALLTSIRTLVRADAKFDRVLESTTQTNPTPFS